MNQLLIIEDDKINRMIYGQILSNDFTTIDYAADGQEGINKFKANCYDVILLDLGLPKINGLQVAQLIREYEANHPYVDKTPIIVITADNFPGTQQQAFDAGVDEYLTKPFNIQHLKSLINTYLQKNKCQVKI